MKQCTKCLNLKNIENYSKKTKASDGLQPWCKTCVVENKRSWIKNNRGRVQINVWYSRYRLREKDINDILQQQDNKCGICRLEFTETPCVDHDHSCCNEKKSCGKCIRGLLCSDCNKRLGGYEYINSIPHAKEYLKARWSSGHLT